MPTENDALRRWGRLAVQVWAWIGILLLLTAAGWLLGRVFSALVPFLIGLVIVLLLRRPVELLESRMPRAVAVVVCYLSAIVALGVLLTFIVPPIYEQVVSFVEAVPGYAKLAFRMWDAYVIHPRAGSGVPDWLKNGALELRDQVVSGAGRWSSILAESAVSTGGSIAGGVVSFIIALIVGFYTLVDLPRLREEVMLLAGPSWRDEALRVLTTVSRVLGGWLRGTIIQSTVVTVLITVLLWIVGVREYALAIGVLGGMFNVVPYAGPLLTALLAAGAGLFVGPVTALWAVIAVFAVQQFDSLFMAPRIMSEQVDLHPLLVILALLVGASLFGVAGMVLSVPVAAIIKGLFVYWFERRTDRQICTDDGALFRTPKDEREGTGA